MKKYLIGLDLGTSAAKGILLAETGELIAEAKAHTEYTRGTSGEVTFDGDEFYTKICGVIRTLVSHLPEGGEIIGIGASSASGNTMLMNKDGKPMCEAISWLDGRVTDEIDTVFGKVDPEAVRDKCGWPCIGSFPIAHLAWYKVHKPELLASAHKICMSTDYVNYRLSGEWAMDPSTATTFYMADQRKGEWNKEYLAALGINEAQLPPLRPTGTLIGHITKEAAGETGLTEGCAVVLGAFDHPTGARGAGILEEGQLLLSCGTSWVGFIPHHDRAKIIDMQLLCDPFLSADGGPWAGMFSLAAVSTKVSAMVEKWVVSGSERLSQFDKLSRSAEPGAGGLRIDPLTDGDRDLSGYEKKNIARAVQEGVAHRLATEVRKLEANGIKINSVVMVGGPSKSDPWPQIVCDMLGVNVDTVYGVCAGAVGAAILAGIATGAYDSLTDAYAKMTPDKIERTPNLANTEIYKNF